MQSNELMKKISYETFADIIAISPRKVRESLFSHYGVKAKSKVLTSMKEKKNEKVSRLFSILREVQSPKEQEFIKELFRNWLLHQRPLLKSTLDYLGVENDNGLIQVETDFFKELSEKQVHKLMEHLKPKYPQDHICIYLSFMEVPFLDTHFK